ncbi:MAG: MarR family transcriptional regulator [Lachnospiraceae bacterium]|nr:MarR family transcriptional regulator [Lachnospiraceae bacterium]MDD3797014.1 MarR family transcriptional regulator [Lachnospiraceae bacterium]
MDLPKGISTLFRKMQMNLNTRLKELSLTSTKAMFLFCLSEYEHLSQIEMCRKLDMDKSTVAKMLVRLESDGLITKSTDPDDIRSYIVTLTDKAMQLVPQARKIQMDWVEEVTANLSDLEKHNFCELVETVAENANQLCV